VIEQLKDFAHSKLLTAQRLQRFVSSPDFERAVDKATHEQKLRIRELIDRMDVKPLQRLVKELTLDDLESLSYRDLREVAKRHHVKYWHRLPKESLIDEIERVREKKNETDSANEHPGNVESDENADSTVGSA
jgi:DNA integrity scanning protein DisA with diadenylate cyclase activity